MDYLDLTKIKKVVITFENFEVVSIESNAIADIGIEPSKWPNMQMGDTTPYVTHISFGQEIDNYPDEFARLKRFRDITWFNVVFRDGRESEWAVPWEDDPEFEDQNALQRNIEVVDKLSIYIQDYNVM